MKHKDDKGKTSTYTLNELTLDANNTTVINILFLRVKHTRRLMICWQNKEAINCREEGNNKHKQDKAISIIINIRPLKSALFIGNIWLWKLER